ncbi:MAG: dihydropyrimidinase [Spirochaetes bacterium]|nr:dihydropyrimidinase [Spirochaetota bacterium]
MKNIIIKGGLVVSEDAEEVCDILCSGEKIKQIGKHISAAGAEVIDAAGMVVIPGGVDVHTHLCLDTGAAVVGDDFYTGTLAAAWGGTTTIVDHPGFGPANCSLDHQIKKYHELARNKAVIDYGFHGVIQHVNDDVLSKMAGLAEEGIASFKLYTTYGYKLCDKDIIKVFERAKELGVWIAVHCENDGAVNHLKEKFKSEEKLSSRYHSLSRPPEAEAEAVSRMVLLAKMANESPLYIVHLTNSMALEFVKSARARGQKNLYVETCPQYLFLDESLYDLPGSEGLKYIMCPPLRGAFDREALWQGLVSDIDIVGTDHCPFFFETQKSVHAGDFTQCPSGAPGIEERVPLMYSEIVAKNRLGGSGLRRFTELCSAAPAKLFGLYPQKGVIKEGSDADIVIIDPAKRGAISHAALHANVDYSAYEGIEVHGWPVCTISRGEVIIRGGTASAKPGRGRFLKRKTLNLDI